MPRVEGAAMIPPMKRAAKCSEPGREAPTVIGPRRLVALLKQVVDGIRRLP